MSCPCLRPGLLVLVVASAVPATAAPPVGPENRLARENSPYLRQHAHNPVDWYPWGPEAFAKAAREGKLVFLSIGYSSCHWCHVMERESFNDPEVAALLNKWFVCIKVDREERPDIDDVYMTALHTIGGTGGWPLSMFLTADGKPIIGGTYWPKEDQPAGDKVRRGFKSVLTLVHELHRDKPKELQQQADQIAHAVSENLARAQRGAVPNPPAREVVAAALTAMKEEFDPVHGGFGREAGQFEGTKFPMPSYLALLQQQSATEPELAGMVALTLVRMARGGIYDQLGGGFHRYSTERTWTVPHFEKMLYDQAQLAERYAAAYRTDPKPLTARVLRETLEFVLRDLTDPQGGFYSALDADADHEEGKTYVWTPAEIDAAIPDAATADLFKKVYGLTGKPNFEGKAFILTLAKDADEATVARLADARARLLAVRAQRPQPFRDTKILTAWNGQMIAGFAAAGQALKEPRYLQAAARAAEFVLTHSRTADGRLRRTFDARPGEPGQARLNAYLDDYGFLVHGLLALHDATGEARWLAEARALTETMVKWHGDAERGGFFYTSHDHEKLFARAKDQYDGAQASGNSVALANLVRLARLTGDARYRKLAERGFQAFGMALRSNPTALTTMVAALANFTGTTADAAPRLPTPAGQPKRSDGVVKATAEAGKPDGDGRFVVTITLQIEKPYHIYANPVGQEMLESAQTTVKPVGPAKPAEFKVEYPPSKPVNDPVTGNYSVYEDKAVIKVTVKRAAGQTGPLELAIDLQACTDKTCLLPGTVKLTVPEPK